MAEGEQESQTEGESEIIVSEIVADLVCSLSRTFDDSLEKNHGLLTALKEISGMVPPTIFNGLVFK